MSYRQNKYFSVEPSVGPGDYRLLGRSSWENIDQAGNKALRTDCIGIPSIRVGMAWTLEYLNCNRHNDHVLLPKYVSRCILNSLNRYALPVESLTPFTRLVVAIHQYGLRPNLDEIRRECDSRGIPFIEDSPYGLQQEERLGVGSLAKFIGLSKILPALKGALVISDDQSLLQFFKQKRKQSSPWSWPVLGVLALLRRRTMSSGESALAAIAYEIYLDSKGDNRWLRSNLLAALQKLDSFCDASGAKLAMIAERLKHRVILPDTGRLSCVVPLFPGAEPGPWQEVLVRSGFDPGIYHIDVARNLFNPSYEKALLLPLNPKTPSHRFEILLNRLAELDGSYTEEGSPDFSSLQQT